MDLLRLPRRCLELVFKEPAFQDPQTLFLLATCSKLSKHLVQTYNTLTARIEVDIGFRKAIICHQRDRYFYLVRVQNPKKAVAQLLWNNNVGDTVMRFSPFGPCLYSYSSDTLEGLIFYGNLACEIFHCDIEQLSLGCRIKHNYKKAIDWINNRQESVNTVYAHFNSKNDYGTGYLLHNINATQSLSLLVKPKDPEIPWDLQHLRTTCIHISHAHWITRDHLLAMDCEYLLLEGSRLRSEDLNAFLRQWCDGAYLQLKEFRVVLENGRLDFDEILEGLDVVEGHGEEVDFRSYNGLPNHLHINYSIQRHVDGTKASIEGSNGTKQFWMIII